MRVLLRRHFDAAHQLPFHHGKCHELHGHRWTVEITIEGEPHPDDQRDPESGMLLDFGRLKALLDDYLPDHRMLNAANSVPTGWPTSSDWATTAGRGLVNPTAERIAERMALDLGPVIDALGLSLVELRIWETPDSCAIVP